MQINESVLSSVMIEGRGRKGGGKRWKYAENEIDTTQRF
jgi:hypothetical protein